MYTHEFGISGKTDDEVYTKIDYFQNRNGELPAIVPSPPDPILTSGDYHDQRLLHKDLSVENFIPSTSSRSNIREDTPDFPMGTFQQFHSTSSRPRMLKDENEQQLFKDLSVESFQRPTTSRSMELISNDRRLPHQDLSVESFNRWSTTEQSIGPEDDVRLNSNKNHPSVETFSSYPNYRPASTSTEKQHELHQDLSVESFDAHWPVPTPPSVNSVHSTAKSEYFLSPEQIFNKANRDGLEIEDKKPAKHIRIGSSSSSAVNKHQMAGSGSWSQSIEDKMFAHSTTKSPISHFSTTKTPMFLPKSPTPNGNINPFKSVLASTIASFLENPSTQRKPIVNGFPVYSTEMENKLPSFQVKPAGQSQYSGPPNFVSSTMLPAPKPTEHEQALAALKTLNKINFNVIKQAAADQYGPNLINSLKSVSSTPNPNFFISPSPTMLSPTALLLNKLPVPPQKPASVELFAESKNEIKQLQEQLAHAIKSKASKKTPVVSQPPNSGSNYTLTQIQTLKKLIALNNLEHKLKNPQQQNQMKIDEDLLLSRMLSTTPNYDAPFLNTNNGLRSPSPTLMAALNSALAHKKRTKEAQIQELKKQFSVQPQSMLDMDEVGPIPVDLSAILAAQGPTLASLLVRATFFLIDGIEKISKRDDRKDCLTF